MKRTRHTGFDHTSHLRPQEPPRSGGQPTRARTETKYRFAGPEIGLKNHDIAGRNRPASARLQRIVLNNKEL